MTNFVISLIRTWVPIGVGAALAWLATLGFDLSPETEGAAILALTALLQAAYYWFARWLEGKFSWGSVLLGHSGAPTYSE